MEDEEVTWAELLGGDAAPQVGLTFGVVKAPTQQTQAATQQKTPTFHKLTATAPPKAPPKPTLVSAPTPKATQATQKLGLAIPPSMKLLGKPKNTLDAAAMFPNAKPPGSEKPASPGPYGLQTPEVPPELQPPPMPSGGGGGGGPAPLPPLPEPPPEPPPAMADTGLPDEMAEGWDGAWDAKGDAPAVELPSGESYGPDDAPGMSLPVKLALGAAAAVALFHFAR
jgi:hypothetical protein